MFINHSSLSYLLIIIFQVTIMPGNAEDFDTYFVELDSSKMITTSKQHHYAISSPSLPSNWRTVSVNGDDVKIGTKDKTSISKKYDALTDSEKSSLNEIQKLLESVIKNGPSDVRSQNKRVKLTTFDRFGGSSVTSYNDGGSSSSSSSSSNKDSESLSMTGQDEFILTRANFPFNWQRLFANGDLYTIVYRDGQVIMQQESLFKQDEREKIVSIKKEVEKSSKVAQHATNSVLNSLHHPMDFVNRALGGFFG